MLPTENNLVTEDGIYNSFHMYGTQDNRETSIKLDLVKNGKIQQVTIGKNDLKRIQSGQRNPKLQPSNIHPCEPT